MANGSLTDEAVLSLREIQRDIREGKREKSIETLFDLVIIMAGLVIQVQTQGCALRSHTKFGWPAAATAVSVIVAVTTLLLKTL